jgi:uncharacterized membrane protein YeaQ/YmgE (transglycosylase-associated protein family)
MSKSFKRIYKLVSDKQTSGIVLGVVWGFVSAIVYLLMVGHDAVALTSGWKLVLLPAYVSDLLQGVPFNWNLWLVSSLLIGGVIGYLVSNMHKLKL